MATGNGIASGSVILSANADQMANGLSEAGKKIESWGAGISGKLGGFLKGGVVGLGVAVGDKLVETVKSGFDRIGELGKINKRAGVLGIDPSELQGFDQLFEKIGLGADEVNGALTKMGRNLLESTSAADALAGSGLDVAKIKGQSLTDQFKQVADAIARLPKGAEQASAAMAVFGRSGATLLPALQRGSAGIDEFIEHQKKVGAVLSDTQIQEAAKAAKAWKEAKHALASAWDGIVNRAAVAIAPLVEKAAEIATRTVEMLQPVFEWFSRGFTQVFELGAAVWDAMAAGVEGVFEWVGNLTKELFTLAGGMPTVQEVIVTSFRAMGTAAAYVWDVIKAGAGVVTYVASFIVDGFGLVVKVFKEVVSLAKELPDDLRPTGLDNFIAGVDRFEKSVHGAADRMREWGKGAVLNFGQSARDFNAWLDRALQKKKKIEEKPKQVMDAINQAAFEPAKFAAAVEKGTKEAYSLTIRNKFAEFIPKQDQVKEAIKQGNRQRDKGNKDLENIRKRLEMLEEV